MREYASCLGVIEWRRPHCGLICSKNVRFIQVSRETAMSPVVMASRGHDEAELIKAFRLYLVRHLLVGLYIVEVFGLII